jgi:antitoxin (DNA-binding transcriptional repressor) of toxin-antitoxin stability system
MIWPQKEKQVRVGVRELRANLSGLLRQARQGASFLVMSRNEVIAEIRPPSGIERPRRVPGLLKGKIRMAEDFDVLPDDVLSAMEGNGD